MKKLLLLVIVFLSLSIGNAQSLWNKTTESRIQGLEKMDRASMPTEFQLYSLDFDAIKQQLALAPSRDVTSTSTVIVSFPNANGKLENYRIFQSSVLHPDLAAKFPDIKTYVGQSVEDNVSTIHISATIFGLHAMVLSPNQGTILIDTYTKNLGNYIVYNKSKLYKTLDYTRQCLVDDTASDSPAVGNKNTLSTLASDGLFRTYRLAMACTIEYAAYHVTAAGLGTGTLVQKKAAVQAAMAVTMVRVGGVYEKDMSLTFQFVANNDAVIFIDTDGFNNTNANTLIGQSQTVIDGAIGTANYDIGHTVSTGGGGLAQRPSVCVAGKARGITGSPAPVGDAYDIDFVAHEMGHQFGANHTFAGDAGNCAGNRSNTTAVEPGSGTTIMAYAGICSPQDVQGNSNDYFHAISIQEMVAHITGAGNCVTGVANGNAAPVIAPLSNYTIPYGTPFKLTAPTATDSNGDVLTYCWEQNNGTFNANSTPLPSTTATNSSNFRSFNPTTDTFRYFPKFADVLNGNTSTTWEVLPNVARTMNFAVTVRDNRMPNGGQTARRDNVVTYANVGPFQMTSPSVADVTWPIGSSQTITWNVAGTTANGINTANVNILISTNGGTSFTTLVANTPNDGSETITVPGPASTTARILIEAVGNVFYTVSKNIAIGYTVTTTCNTYSNNTAMPIPDGAGANTPGTVVSKTIVVPAPSGVISDVNVTLGFTHTYIEDLVIAMNHPDGTQVSLWNRNCDNAPGTLQYVFDDAGAAVVPNTGCTATSGTWKPQSLLSTLNGKNNVGTWTLLAADFFNGDTGTINNWSIEVCAQTAVLVTENFGLDNFVLYPNPNNGNFNIQFNSSISDQVQVNVHDMRGREIFNKNYQNTGMFNQNLNLDNVQSGVYLVTVKNGNRKEVKKIVVE